MRTGARFDPDCDDDLTLHSTPNVDVMGANIPTQTVRVEVRSGTTRLRFPLPEDFKLPTTDSTAISNLDGRTPLWLVAH
jgi:hypothetical protein